MANMCELKASPHYTESKKRLSIKEGTSKEKQFNIDYYTFVEGHGRPPHFDEIPNVDSTPYLEKALKINQNNSVNNETLLKETNTTNVYEAVAELNDTHRDVDIEVLPLAENSIITINKRSSEFNNRPVNEIYPIQDNISNVLAFNKVLTKLINYYGYKIIPITTAELLSEEFKFLYADASSTKAFIKDGNVYINIDKISADAPLHETLHLLLSSLRFKNPTLYLNLILYSLMLPEFTKLASTYKNRTMNDVLEEIFVDLVAKYYTGLESLINMMPESTKYELGYNITRVLDTILMGDFSTRSIPIDNIFNLNLKLLASLVNSSLFVNKFTGTLDEGAQMRIASNVKSELLKSGELKLECF